MGTIEPTPYGELYRFYPEVKQLNQRNKELEAIVTNIQATIDYLHYDDRKITVRQLKQLLKGGE